MPTSSEIELGPEQWPQLILGALIILIIINMVRIYKQTPADSRNFNGVKNIRLLEILKSKLFLGIMAVFIYSIILERIGFILNTFIFFIAYSRLIGEKRIKVLLISAFIVTFGIYFIFASGLGIMLPRGYGILRDFALLLESF